MNTVVITGANRGLGRVLAEKFAEKNWQVIGVGRSERPSDLLQSIAYQQFDAANAAACTAFWSEIAQAHGTLHLINNAGAYISGNVADTSAADFQNQMTGNYFTSVFMTKSLIAAAPKAKIINIISTGALAAHPNQSAYGASKAAVMHFFQSLKEEVSPHDYQITNIYPSDIATHGVNKNAIDPADLASFIIECAERKDSLFVSDLTVYPSKISA